MSVKPSLPASSYLEENWAHHVGPQIPVSTHLQIADLASHPVIFLRTNPLYKESSTDFREPNPLYTQGNHDAPQSDYANPNYFVVPSSSSDDLPLDQWAGGYAIAGAGGYDQSGHAGAPYYDCAQPIDRVWKTTFVPALAEASTQPDAHLKTSPPPLKKAHSLFCGSRTRKAVTVITATLGVAAVVGVVASKFLAAGSSNSQEESQAATQEPCLNAMLGGALNNFTQTVKSLPCVNQATAKAVALTVNQTFCSTAGAVGIFVINTLAALGLPLVYYNRSSAPNELPPSQLTKKEIDAIINQIENAQEDVEEFCEPAPSSVLPSASLLPTPSASLPISQTIAPSPTSTQKSIPTPVNSVPPSSSSSQFLKLSSGFPQPTPSPTLPVSSAASRTSSGSVLAPSSTAQISSSQAPLPPPSPSSSSSSLTQASTPQATLTPTSQQPPSSTTRTSTSSTTNTTTAPINWAFSQTSAPSGNWGSVSASSSGQYLAAVDLDGNGNLYLSSNYGVSWSQSSAPAGSWESVTSSSSGQFLAAVQYNNNGHIYLSSNYGGSWSQSSAPSGNWGSIASSYSGQYLAAVQYNNGGNIYLSSNYGASWTKSSVSAGNWDSVSSSSSGQYLVAIQAGGNIYLSSNYGASWSLSSAPASHWNSVTSSSSGQFLAAVQYYNGNIYLSSDYGTSWSLSSAPASHWNSIASSSSGQFLAAVQGGGNIYLSSNYGASWTQSSAPTGNWDSVTMSSDGTRIIAVQYNGGIWIGSPT